MLGVMRDATAPDKSKPARDTNPVGADSEHPLLVPASEDEDDLQEGETVLTFLSPPRDDE
jgi:hypothetical protein